MLVFYFFNLCLPYTYLAFVNYVTFTFVVFVIIYKIVIRRFMTKYDTVVVIVGGKFRIAVSAGFGLNSTYKYKYDNYEAV